MSSANDKQAPEFVKINFNSEEDSVRNGVFHREYMSRLLFPTRAEEWRLRKQCVERLANIMLAKVEKTKKTKKNKSSPNSKGGDVENAARNAVDWIFFSNNHTINAVVGNIFATEVGWVSPGSVITLVNCSCVFTDILKGLPKDHAPNYSEVIIEMWTGQEGESRFYFKDSSSDMPFAYGSWSDFEKCAQVELNREADVSIVLKPQKLVDAFKKFQRTLMRRDFWDLVNASRQATYDAIEAEMSYDTWNALLNIVPGSLMVAECDSGDTMYVPADSVDRGHGPQYDKEGKSWRYNASVDLLDMGVKVPSGMPRLPTVEEVNDPSVDTMALPQDLLSDLGRWRKHFHRRRSMDLHLGLSEDHDNIDFDDDRKVFDPRYPPVTMNYVIVKEPLTSFAAWFVKKTPGEIHAEHKMNALLIKWVDGVDECRHLKNSDVREWSVHVMWEVRYQSSDQMAYDYKLKHGVDRVSSDLRNHFFPVLQCWGIVGFSHVRLQGLLVDMPPTQSELAWMLSRTHNTLTMVAFECQTIAEIEQRFDARAVTAGPLTHYLASLNPPGGDQSPKVPSHLLFTQIRAVDASRQLVHDVPHPIDVVTRIQMMMPRRGRSVLSSKTARYVPKSNRLKSYDDYDPEDKEESRLVFEGDGTREVCYADSLLARKVVVARHTPLFTGSLMDQSLWETLLAHVCPVAGVWMHNMKLKARAQGYNVDLLLRNGTVEKIDKKPKITK